MKIHSIRFKNINALKGTHFIDFEAQEFTQSPLFAITGPTGSGKTTILDVISLALFNKVPRLDSISKNSIKDNGAILTRNQKEALAEVTYACQKGVFTSVWSIGTTRNNTLRDYEMDLYQENPHKRIDLNKSQVPVKNEELIGLNYNQFVKSVVLAQGEFAEFLQADEKDRSELLEKITGTEIYRELGIKAFRKFKDKSDEINNLINLRKAEEEKKLDADKRKHIEKEARELDKQFSETQNTLDKVKNNLSLSKEIGKLEKIINDKNKTLSHLKSEFDVFKKEKGKLIENHEHIQAFSSELHSWKHLSQQLKSIKDEQKHFDNTKEKREKEQAKLLQQIQLFIGGNCSPKETNSKLQEFYKKVAKLQEDKKELEQNYKHGLAHFSGEIRAIQHNSSAKDLVENKDLWNRLLATNKREKEKYNRIFDGNLPENTGKKIDAEEERLELLNKAAHDDHYIRKLQEAIKKLKTDVTKLEETHQNLPGKIEKLKGNAALQSEKLKSLRTEQELSIARAKLEDFKKHLKPGEPCLLCGSTEHPGIDDLPDEKSALEKKIEKKALEVDKLKENLSAWRTKFEENKKQLKEKQDELEEKEDEEDNLKERFAEKFKFTFKKEKPNWNNHIKQQRTKIQRLKEYQEFEKAELAFQQADPLHKELQEVIKNGIKKKEEIENYYKGDDLLGDVRQYENAWQELVQNLKTTGDRLLELDKKKDKKTNQLLTLTDKIIPELNNKGFETVKSALKALMPADQYKVLKQKSDHYNKEIEALGVELKTRGGQLQDLESRFTSDEDEEELKKKKTELEEKSADLDQRKNEKRRLLRNDDELQSRTKELEEQIKKEEQENFRWKVLNDLIGDSKGNKFNQFAQHLTLLRLLNLANDRLKEISERYRLKINEDSSKGLVVADLDMGGQERSVKTLSGGETFLMSLSLALALSDLASKKVNINSLFIDEGFGTLDVETLDQTLDTLERLQASTSKTIGIISHVDSLKERISTQIQLAKDGHGYSSLRIASS